MATLEPAVPLDSSSTTVPGLQLPLRVQTYLDAVVAACAQAGHPLVSIILFGSAAKGGFSTISDVDLIFVLPDDATREYKRRLRVEVGGLETAHGFRPAAARPPGAFQARVERAVGHLFACGVCTRAELISGDVARVLDLRPWEMPFVDRIVFASIVGSAVTVWGEDLLPRVPVPPVRRLDIFKALFAISNQVVLSVMTFPVLPDATKYAMGALKHSLHSCYFCYHQRTAALEEEVAFFNQRLGANRTLAELLSLRRDYRRSFAFVIRCLPTVARLHLRTARDGPDPGTDRGQTRGQTGVGLGDRPGSDPGTDRVLTPVCPLLTSPRPMNEHSFSHACERARPENPGLDS